MYLLFNRKEMGTADESFDNSQLPIGWHDDETVLTCMRNFYSVVWHDLLSAWEATVHELTFGVNRIRI